MFVRVKKRKRKEYAYLVENIWTSKGTRQKVKKYLGRVIEIKSQEPSRLKVDVILKKNPEEFVKEIIKDELVKKGFKEENGVLKRGEIEVRKDYEIKESGKKVVIKNNEGFICKETIDELIKFVKKQEEKNYDSKEKIMKELAKRFLEAGLPANENYFVILGDKIIKKRTMKEPNKEREEDEQEFYY